MEAEKVDGAGRADVLIIGGGVVGLCSAYYLLRAGRSVTLVEQAQLGAGSSTGNAGLIVPSHSLPLAAPGVVRQSLGWLLRGQGPFAIQPRLDPGLINWLWRFAAACNEATMRRHIPVLRDLSRASAALFAQLVQEEQLDCAYGQHGTLALYRSARGFESAAHEAELLAEYDMPVDVLDGPAARRLEPAVGEAVVGALLFREDANLNPAQFVAELARCVRAAGARILESTSVSGFITRAGRIEAVQTPAGKLEARELVLAAGAWSPLLAAQLNLPLPVRPAKGYSLTLDRPADSPRLPVMFGERKVAVAPIGPLLRCTGWLELAGYDLRVRPARLEQIRRSISEYLRLAELPSPRETWAGLRPATPDGLPIIGRVLGYENLTLATGHGMLGVSLGPVTGWLVAQQIVAGRTDIDLTPLRAERFA
jgi:D-amino-acid dehydrogenase